MKPSPTSTPMPAVQVTDLTKIYPLYSRHSDRLKEALHPLRKKYHQDFHALSNISFQINGGEALGILGGNGSGKSTLLKIITGVLTPTSGSVAVAGKISALLELGTGFNPELTGLENIFFSGTIQGREREETESMVPDILAFADIGPYVHQPVKTYSSGMFARLAFAVAVNVNPDILIVDEALSVGDMRFQQKCLRKMQTFRDQGKTILFVSHDIASITTFCDKALWLDQGHVREHGETRSVCKRYVTFMAYGTVGDEASPTQTPPPEAQPDEPLSCPTVHWQSFSECDSSGVGKARITKAALLDAATSRSASSMQAGQRLRLLMHVDILSAIPSICFGLVLTNRLGQSIFALNNWYLENRINAKAGTVVVSFSFVVPTLAPGKYSFSLAVAEGTLQEHTQHHWVHDAIFADVTSPDSSLHAGSILVLPHETYSMDWEFQGHPESFDQRMQPPRPSHAS